MTKKELYLRKIIKEEIKKIMIEDATDNAKDTYYIGNVNVLLSGDEIFLESKNGKTETIKWHDFGKPSGYEANPSIDSWNFKKILQFLSENN